MDDLNSVISSILGDPQKMEQLRNVAQSLGMNPDGPPPGFPGQAGPSGNDMGGVNQSANPGPQNMNQQPPMNDQGPMNNMGGGMGNMGGMNNMGNNPGQSQNGGGFNLGSLGKLAGMLGGTGNANDKNVQLLRALQPHISTSRAGRIDDAVRIMQLMSAWPALRDSGILGSLGNLFTGGGHK